MRSPIPSTRLTAAILTGLACSISPTFAQDNKPPVPSGNVTVSCWGIATQPWQVMIDDFQKTYPNIKIKWTKYSTDEMNAPDECPEPDRYAYRSDHSLHRIWCAVRGAGDAWLFPYVADCNY